MFGTCTHKHTNEYVRIEAHQIVKGNQIPRDTQTEKGWGRQRSSETKRKKERHAGRGRQTHRQADR